MDFIKATACVVLVLLAFSDARSRRLPNPWVGCFAALYLADAFINSASLVTVGAHGAVAVLMLALTALLFRFGWLGGGDAKLAAAVFLWCGPDNTLSVVLIISICGTLLGLLMLADAWMREHIVMSGTTGKKAGVPYGIALATGGVVAVLLQPTLGHPVARALAKHAGLA